MSGGVLGTSIVQHLRGRLVLRMIKYGEGADCGAAVSAQATRAALSRPVPFRKIIR